MASTADKTPQGATLAPGEMVKDSNKGESLRRVKAATKINVRLG